MIKVEKKKKTIYNVTPIYFNFKGDKNVKRVLICIFLVFSFLSSNTLEEIKNKKTIRVGVFTDEPPFSVLKNGSYEGFEIDFIKAISKDLFSGANANIEFVNLSSKDRIPLLEKNAVDMVVAQFTVTEERKKSIDFTMPYFSVNVGVLTRKADNIKNFNDLIGKKILAKKGTTADEFFKSKNIETINCESTTECVEMVKNGTGDGWAADNLTVLAMPLIMDGLEVKIQNLGTADFLAIGVQKGNSDFLKFLNQEMIKLSTQDFFKSVYDNTLQPFYKGTADKKYFLLDDIYSVFSK